MPENTRRIFIQEVMHKHSVAHGGIGLIDMEKILYANGFEPVFFPAHYDFSFLGKIRRLAFFLKTVLRLSGGKFICVFKVPVQAKLVYYLLHFCSRKSNVTFVCYVADLDGLRGGDERLFKKEIQFLKRFKNFIVHTPEMQQLLMDNGVNGLFSPLYLFDFLAAPNLIKREKSCQVAFAGNLFKSTFLENVDQIAASTQLHFHIYGPNQSVEMENQKSATYHGCFEPYDLPAIMKGAFGLVWDGDGVEKPIGLFGDYMQFIAHHKASLYLMAGMPVIVYDKAGTSKIIVEANAGFAVSSLAEIEERINALTDAEYQVMAENAQSLAKRLSSGTFLLKALTLFDKSQI